MRSGRKCAGADEGRKAGGEHVGMEYAPNCDYRVGFGAEFWGKFIRCRMSWNRGSER
jgi:hypothetical protein